MILFIRMVVEVDSSANERMSGAVQEDNFLVVAPQTKPGKVAVNQETGLPCTSAQCYKTFFPSEISMSEFPPNFKLLSKVLKGACLESNCINVIFLHILVD